MNIDPYIIYNIFSYLEPSRDKLDLISRTHSTYNKYKLDVETEERNYTNKVLCHVCKSAFYMDVLIDDDYQDYEDLKNYLKFVNNIPYFRDNSEVVLRLYDLDQYFSIFKDLIHYLFLGSIDTIPIQYNYKKNKRFYKKKYIYSDTVYNLLLLD